MKAQVLNAQEMVYEGVISEAVLPGVDGELSVMDYHEPCFVALKRGYIRLTPLVKKIGLGPGERIATGQIQGIRPIRIQRGVARVKGNNEIIILVE